eukprot:764629-Hanusia_phi.AAC.2
MGRRTAKDLLRLPRWHQDARVIALPGPASPIGSPRRDAGQLSPTLRAFLDGRDISPLRAIFGERNGSLSPFRQFSPLRGTVSALFLAYDAFKPAAQASDEGNMRFSPMRLASDDGGKPQSPIGGLPSDISESQLEEALRRHSQSTRYWSSVRKRSRPRPDGQWLGIDRRSAGHLNYTG